MQDREPYMGYAIAGIDLKGRVSIPACLRGPLERNGESRTITFARHANAPCLIGYDRGWTRYIGQNLIDEAHDGAGSGSAIERDNARRRAFGLVDEVPFDASGRFVMQGFLRTRARLEDTAVFCGIGNTFEIWSPKVVLETPDIDDDLKEYVRWEMARRGGQ